jgi:hypothetical protein
MVVSRSEAAMALVCGGGLLLLLCLRGLLIMMADAMLRDAATSPAHGPERVLSRLRAALARRSQSRRTLGGDRAGAGSEGGVLLLGAREVRDGVQREGAGTGSVRSASVGGLRAKGAVEKVPALGRGARVPEEKDNGGAGAIGSAGADSDGVQDVSESNIMLVLWAAATSVL